MSIIIPEGTLILDTIVGTLNLFKMANSYSKRIGNNQEDFFKIDLVGLTKEPISCHEYFQIKPTKTIEEVESTNLIIISSITGNIEDALVKNEPFINWIKMRRIKDDADVASLCRSAFILAETGLLNGKTCATHWVVHQKFEEKYPKIHLLPDKIISEDNGIYSSGGAYSFLNMIVYLIEKYYGRETAIWCSKMAEIDFDRINQNQFVIFKGQKEHSDEIIKAVQIYIEENFEEKLSVKDLAKKFAISSRTFIRRFKKATLNTPLEYMQRVKVEVAKKSFESSTLNINQVMYNVGYNDQKSFRKTFKKYTGLSPLEYRTKYNREMALS
ncbi:GlxA family transcriptional regulator [uncultured Eudoraea sp.]|uniref:GlxA family transcriptional regulator n=1 Tax=uncultured Eudoraea sp. TaxID=1035614 RepID=UPI002611775A|nr:helix-turn-helix domain-containing protein [uncultured Eudoraea sp.]